MWDVTKSFRVAFEVAQRSTASKVLRDNAGIGFQTQVQWKFQAAAELSPSRR